jgi:hypothetical protein
MKVKIISVKGEIRILALLHVRACPRAQLIVRQRR